MDGCGGLASGRVRGKPGLAFGGSAATAQVLRPAAGWCYYVRPPMKKIPVLISIALAAGGA